MGGNNYNYGINYGVIGNGGVVNNQQVYNDRVNYGMMNNIQWTQLDAEMSVLDRNIACMPQQIISAYGEIRASVCTRDESRLKCILCAVGREALDFFKQLGLSILPSIIMSLLV